MIDKNKIPFTKSELENAIRIWNHVSVSLLDIRHCLIPPNEAVPACQLPANAFLYVSGPKAEVLLNETACTIERFGLFHSVKGSILSIYPADDWLEYYLLLYKAGEPLHGQTNPFYQPYGFTPSNPLFFMEHLRNMYERFNNPSPLNAFYGKTAFYQFVFEVYEMLSQESVALFETDIITSAKRYLDRHYKEPISIQDMCGMLGISYSSLYRNFKKKTGKTPQEYLIDTRLTVIMHPDNATNQLYDNGVWKSLNAVKEGRFFEITEEEYKRSFDMPGIVQIEEQINLYTDRFLNISK